MITIDWILFVLMLAGTSALSAFLGLLLGCRLKGGRKGGGDLCSTCKGKDCLTCCCAGKGMGYERKGRG